MNDAFFLWWRYDATKDYRVVPFIISWGIWIARNDAIFKDLTKTPTEISSKTVGIFEFFS